MIWSKLLVELSIFRGNEKINLGCSVKAFGKLVSSNHPGQSLELQANSIAILGTCDPVVNSRYGNDQYCNVP